MDTSAINVDEATTSILRALWKKEEDHNDARYHNRTVLSGRSILHRLDPRVKFVSTLAYIVSLFVFSSWLGYGVAALFLVAMIVLSKVPFGFMIKGLKPIMVLLLITMFFNLVFTPGEVLWSFWILKITKEGIRLAIKMGIRLVFLIIGASIMTLTTTPNQLTDGLERLLRPLNKIHVPVHEIAMMMSIALRFIPI